MINTVLGKIDKFELGNVLCHEHVIIDLTGVRGDIDSALTDTCTMASELALANDSGIDSIIEVTNIGMGRDVKKLEEVSKKTGINIIASTGFYTIPYYPEYIFTKTAEELSQIMIKEIVEGIDDTSIKAGVIGEIGTSLNEISPVSLKVYEAAFLAHKETGVPIFTNCEMGTMGYEQAMYFKNLKMDMDKLLIGHVDLVKDLDYIVKILETGANIGFDTIGKESYVSNQSKAKLLFELVKLGYEDKIMLSQDVTRVSYLKRNNGFGYVEVMNKFIPLLKKGGLSEKVINKFMVDNPKRILG